jgi:hypothetical protein
MVGISSIGTTDTVDEVVAVKSKVIGSLEVALGIIGGVGPDDLAALF